ncbi:histidine kinase [Calothrix sp. FACHB-1219]|uniref:histidine kinase n=1 Tax=unclassified Calothrix TaxID=2619626 RepID=UPI00168422C6|nr:MULTISPECIES: histidine kinase [unclassified Calothrix]MBD2204926.1 histidine kinase [Calothrix sp. FACHB-168]MBD2216249.1 histidine kinase [Calothrix sp. FACHB-1219]
MSNNIKEKIQTDLQQAKATGQLRSDRIREIVKAAVSQVASEFKAGSLELRTIVKDAVSAVMETVQERGSEIKEEVTASIEGVLEGVNSQRHENIAKTQTEIKRLQSQLDSEEEQLQKDVDVILAEIEETGKETSTSTKTVLDSVINGIKDSEEATLLKKRYAQLQAQLAIVRANLAARYGGRSEEVQNYLEDAKHWYNQARPQAENIAAQVEQKRSQLDDKLGEAGSAIARKERQLKQTLREVLLAAADLFKDKDHSDQPKLPRG